MDAVPILWDTTAVHPDGVATVQVLKTLAVLAVARRFVGKGAGPDWAKPKYVTVLSIRPDLHVLNTHWTPSATRSAKYLGKVAKAARMTHYRLHVRAVVKVANQLPGTVLLAGDFNAEHDFRPLRPVHAAGFTAWSIRPTMGRRAIDHVLVRPAPGTEVVEQAVVQAPNTDHRSPVTTIRVTTAPARRPR